MKLHDQYEFKTLLFLHAFANGNLPRSFDNIFKYNLDMLTGHKTRQSNMIQIDCCYSNFSKHLPLYSMPKLCNIWSKQIKQNVTCTCFKRMVKNKILSCYKNSVQCKNPWCTVIKDNRVILHSFAVTSSDNTYKFPLLSFVFHTFI